VHGAWHFRRPCHPTRAC